MKQIVAQHPHQGFGRMCSRVLLMSAMAALLGGCFDRPPSHRDAASAFESLASSQGAPTTITISSLECTKASDPPAGRPPGPGYYCEFEMSQNPRVFNGPAGMAGWFDENGGEWFVYYFERRDP